MMGTHVTPVAGTSLPVKFSIGTSKYKRGITTTTGANTGSIILNGGKGGAGDTSGQGANGRDGQPGSSGSFMHIRV